jgi:23S rRNA pseudouridine2605 synthase
MSEPQTDKSEVRDGQRIAKAMARAGLCSRRDAEAWIEAGRVSVNGAILHSPAFNVGPDDDVRVDGERLRAAERTRLFFFHKPRGLVTTARDPEGRRTIFEALPEDLPRVVAVGRLDINTEGLLLLTNDGGLARVLELPATGWLRRYRVRAHGEVLQSQLDALREGVTIAGIHYAGIEARLEREQGSNVWIMMGLREGKNREIKRVLEHVGLAVNRLIRVSFGPFELGDLPEGAVAELNTRILRDQLGLKLAKQAGANFDAPIESRAPPVAPPPRDGRRAGGERGERPRPPVRGREDRAEIARELATRGQRSETVAPRKRKHVSALRAEARAGAEGPRKRIERGATSDRKGREIKVERIMTAREPAPAPVPVPRKYADKRASPGPGRNRAARPERSGPPRAAAKWDQSEGRAARPFREATRRAEGGGRDDRASRPERADPAREYAGKREERTPRPAPRASEGRAAGRDAPRREFPAKRDDRPPREGRPFRQGAKAGESGSREARPARSGPKREFAGKRDAGKRDAGPGREGRPFRAGPPGEGGKPPSKSAGKRPPRRT